METPAQQSADGESHTATPRSDTTKKPTPWSEALRIARLRDERRSQGLDASVRALARELACSRGRAGELLQIYDVFASDLILIGKGNTRRGEELLTRLTFRQFRELLRIDARMTMTRIFAVQQMSDGGA